MIIVLILSFILESKLSLYLNGTYFSVLLVVSTLSLIYPFYYKNEKKYFITVFITGFLYDIIFTNTFLFNAIIFLILGIIIKKISIYLMNNIFGTIIMNILVIITFLLLSYIGLLIGNYHELNFLIFTKILSKNIIANVIYSGILYLILDRISVKYKILKVN